MKTLTKGILTVAALTGLVACGGGSGGGNSGSSSNARKVSISGKIDGVSLSSFSEQILAGLTDNYISCQVLGSLPPVASTSELGADGSFSLQILMSPGDALGCFLRQTSTAPGFIPLLFQVADSMGGGQTGQGAYSPRPDTKNINLGTIAFDFMNGQAIATLANPPEEDGEAPAHLEFADMTGKWKISKTHSDQKNNFFHPCDLDRREMSDQEYNNCMKNNWKEFFFHTYRASKAGTTNWGISIWEPESSYIACGRSEALDIDPSWTVDNSVADANKLEQAFPAVTLDFSNLDALAARAPFRKQIHSSSDTNCPYNNPNSPSCATATTCADLDYSEKENSGDPDRTAAEMSREKMRCIARRLSSGGVRIFDWQGACARRLTRDAFDDISDDLADYDANGCVTSNCSGDNANGLSASSWEKNPHFRRFQSELILNGNIGTGTSQEIDRQEPSGLKCHTIRTHKLTVIQKTKTTASVLIEISVAPQLGANWDDDCLDIENIRDEVEGGIRKIKLEVTKAK